MGNNDLLVNNRMRFTRIGGDLPGMKLRPAIGLAFFVIALAPQSEARSSHGYSGIASHEIKPPSTRIHKGPSQGHKAMYYRGAKPHVSKHPSPKHKDFNYAQWGGNSPQD